jgi:hypothetical protein
MSLGIYMNGSLPPPRNSRISRNQFIPDRLNLAIVFLPADDKLCHRNDNYLYLWAVRFAKTPAICNGYGICIDFAKPMGARQKKPPGGGRDDYA